MSPHVESLNLPRHPPAPARSSFPLLAVLAPLVGAGVLFAVTQSALMLGFAALSPVIAVAGTVDGRLSARRRRRADDVTYAAARTRFLDDVSRAHDLERAALDAEHPSAERIMTDAALRARRWTGPVERFVPIRLGDGAVPSALAIAGIPETAEERELVSAARVLEGAPVLADPAEGIGVVGPFLVARAFARGLVAQLANAHPPTALHIVAPDDGRYEWVEHLPHRMLVERPELVVRLADGAAAKAAPVPEASLTATIAVSERVDDLPAGCRIVLEVDGSGTARSLTAWPAAASGHAPPLADLATELVAELVTEQSVVQFADELRTAARSRGVGIGGNLPDSVLFTDLPEAPEPFSRSSAGLPATIGVGPDGPLEIDLASSGPHAIVTGTTGSGKSELLITWVLAMAARATPAAVNFLLVDFKGGTAFDRLASLPHTVGVVTDLAHGEASRALKSLRAELRRREGALASLGKSDVRDADGALSRLVIVVDEAAAMLAAFPDLAALFSDLAARGRALGVHLVLGTQRSTGVLADALVANCALRLSLRLSSEADSRALLGTDAAARLPHGVPGRLVAVVDGGTVTAHAATSSAEDVAAVVARHAGSPRARSPWLPQLPARLALSAFPAPPADAVVLGACDDPEHQAQQGILYEPSRAHLLVIGSRQSGKSSALAAVAAQWRGRAIRVPDDIEGAWDALERAEAMIRDPSTPHVVLIDDLDGLLARFDDEHRDAVLDRIRLLLVDGPRAGVAVVCSATALPSGLRMVASRFGEKLILRQGDRQEHVLAGAPAELYDETWPPGRAVWRGLLAQVVQVPAELAARPMSSRTRAEQADEERCGSLEFAPGTVTLIAARAPISVARALRAALRDSDDAVVVIDLSAADPQRTMSEADGLTVTDGESAIVIVGDPDAWQSHWSLLARLRPRAAIVFDGCTLAQVRGILHSRVLPPATEFGHAVLCDPDGEFRRVRMPAEGRS